MSGFKVSLMYKEAVVPTKATTGSAGYDLFSCENVTLLPHSRMLVSTGIKIQVKNDCYARIAPRSGLAVKGIDIGAGVVDSDYRGEVKVLMINNKDLTYNVNKGDRIAQLILERIYNDVEFELVSENDLNSSSRGEGGFGSTGK